MTSDCPEHITYGELRKVLCKHNEKIEFKGEDKRPLKAVIVFRSDNWPDRDYSLQSRSYELTSDNKAFIPGMGGYSIFAASLEENSGLIRLERVMYDEHGGEDGWRVDYCYLLNEVEE